MKLSAKILRWGFVFMLSLKYSLLTSMKKAINEGFVKSTKDNTQPITDQISQFMATLHQAIEVGDVYEFIYLPEQWCRCFTKFRTP